MPNSLVEQYRKDLASRGMIDPRPDDFITYDLGRAASQSGQHDLFTQYPDFASDWQAVREANAPSLAGEAGRAIKAGTQELAATGLGLGALVTDSDYLKNKARSFQEDAAANAPTIPTMDDIGGVKDAARYGIAKIAGSVPSLAEGVGLAIAGGAAGSALGPEGTVAGAAEGAMEGFLGRGVIKSAIKRLLATQGEEMVAAKLIPEATESAVASTLKEGAPDLLKAIQTEAQAITARRAGTAANALNMYGLNAGALYNETGDRETAAIGGAVGALPAIALPEIVVHKLYPGVAASVGERLGTKYVTRLATEALKDAGVLGSAMALQETANTISKNIAAGKEPTDISDDDWKRIREAAVGGALTGPLISPLTARENADVFNPAAAKAKADAVRIAQAAPQSMPAEAVSAPEQPIAVEPVVPPSRKVALMSPEEKASRLDDLIAREANLTSDEQTELTLLQALVPRTEAQPMVQPEAPVSVEPVAEQPLPDALPIRETNDNTPSVVPTPSLAEPLPVAAGDTGIASGTETPAAVTPAATGLIEPNNFYSPAGESKVAPAVYLGFQEDGRGGGFEVWNLTEDIPGHTKDSTVSRGTLEAEGYTVPAAPVESATTDSSITNSSSLDAQAAQPSALAEPIKEPIIPESPKLEQRLREELHAPEPIKFGPVAAVDISVPADIETIDTKGALSDTGNTSTTRIGVVLQAPTGDVVMAGLLPRKQIASIEGGKKFGLAVQEMGSKEGGAHSIKLGGKVPALLSDLVKSGYKYLGKVTFDADPGKIFQRWANKDVFAASLKAAQEGGTEDAPASRDLARIEAEADGIHSQMSEASPIEQIEMIEQLHDLAQKYRALGGDPKFMREAPNQPPLPIEADRTAQFASAVAAAKQAGLKVDVLTDGFLRASLADEITRRIDSLSEKYTGLDPTGIKAKETQSQIERLQTQLEAVNSVRGVAYSPWHIAVGLQDVQQQTITGLVALLHEVGHSIAGRSTPEMQGKITHAVTAAFADLTAERAGLEAKTGVREANLSDPEELLVSTMAQRLATEGVPQSSSLARAIFQWVKDLYYRMAMGVQAAFGREPDPQLALDWFENQIRRTVGGDYDYRFAGIFDRFQPEVPSQEVVRYQRSGGTPGDVSDFYDPLAERVRQPDVMPDTNEGIAWNLKFMADDGVGKDKELDIPYREATARIMGAAVNEEAELLAKAYDEIVPKQEGQERMTLEDFWVLVGQGDSPQSRLAGLEQQFKDAGKAAIGGERMTDAMNQQARVTAKKLVYKLQKGIASKNARLEERGAKAEENLVDQAKALTKVEGNLRNAEMHEATLRDSLKDMIRKMAQGINRGLDTAFAAGELANAVREAEGLAEKDPIPKEYQRVFKAVLADEIPVFEYLNSIAQLDMPLKDMTRAEILAGIEDSAAGDNALAQLIEPKNKPLLVALAALAKKNAEQMDLIQMRAIKDPEQYLALKSQLDEIRNANPAKLRELERKINEGKKATTFADRIKQNAIKLRTRLRRSQDTIKEVEETRSILSKMRASVDAKVDEIETNGMPAPSEWMPFDGEKYLAMTKDKDGRWRSAERTLEWTPDGPAKNGDQILGDLAANAEYLREQREKKGTKTYQLVERMTNELNMVDVLRKTPEIKRVWLEKFMLPTAKLLVSGGGAGAARAEQMLQKFQFLTDTKYWRGELEIPSIQWSNSLKRAATAAGMKDQRAFLDQIYEPIVYQIESEPGQEQGPAIREAVRAAKRRLTTEAKPEFDDAIKDLLIRTKDMSERFLKVAQDNGLFVQDEKLGELRTAIARGWMTVMRSMNSATVSTILRDMENAGWKMVFKDAETGEKSVKRLDKGAGAGQRVVAAASFDALLPDPTASEASNKARMEVLENPDAFSKAISGFFTPGIVQRWLEPFINKPGESAFYQGDAPIDPMEVQRAWQDSGGNVAKWIDLLGERLGLDQNIELGDELTQGDLSLEAGWRAAMLKRLDALFLMESRIAADSNQTRGLFDATGKPPHLIMDSRENELLPPEHVQHAVFDRDSSRNLLATLAFHAAFGRNGEAMTKAVTEIQTNLKARKSAFDTVVGQANSKEARERKAKELGYEFKELKRAAGIYQTVEQGLAALKAQFGFNSSATMLNDVRGGLELLHFIASQTTNNPKTGLLNLIQPAQRAIARRSIGTATVRDTAGAYGEIGKQFFGQVLENFGLHLLRASRNAADIGAAQGQGIGQLPWSEVAGMTAGRRGEDLSPAIKTMRSISAVQRKGIRPGFGESREFPRLQAVPVASNVMHGIGLAAAISNGTAESRAIEGVVNAAMQHFAANPDHLNDPTYRLTHQDIAANDKTLAMDRAAFDYFRSKMVEYNIGPLEAVTRAAMERQTRGEPILTKDQVLKATQLAGNEVDLQAGINTNPASWDTNPVLKFATPLLGWPIRQMNSIHEAMRDANGRATALQAMKTLGILAAWSLPVGLAFTFLTDQYDDKILRKKTNLGRVDPLALIPGIGAPLALATSDIPAKEHLVAMFQRLSRAGNIYGLGMDFLATKLAGMDPTSGQRPFSMDSRILAFSQLQNISDAFSNWYNSGFATTYANFERPLIQALTGSGPLQAIEAIGGALGIDNQEMRITERTNVSQWLRAAGREVGLELRRSGGGSVAPTPTSVWTREMYLAALANDRLSYMDAYRRAIEASREAGDAKPEQKVLESWKARDPREVFRTKPDDTQIARMLSVMNDNGREAVQSAMRLFQQYTDMIAVTPAERYQNRMLSQASRLPNMNSLRAQMAGGALSFR